MILEKFDKVGLEEIQKISLIKRVDQKFMLKREDQYQILEDISDSYLMLEIDGKSSFQYETVYFDTAQDDMYKAHHNGKLNQLKLGIETIRTQV